MGVFDKAAEFLKKGEVKITYLDRWRITVAVGKYEVRYQIKEGSVLDSCSCTNHARYNKLNPRCSHKLAASTLLTMKKQSL